MDLNNLELSNKLLVNIYRNSLVELSNDITYDVPGAPDSEKGWKYLGDNKKNILIIVNYNEAAYLPDDHLTLLTNILAACKICLGDVAIFNLKQRENPAYKEIVNHFKCRIVLLFDVAPLAFGLPIQFPHFQVQLFNKCTYLLSPSLEELERDKNLKKKLWLCLQRIFSD